MDLWNQDTMNAPWGVASRLKIASLAVRFFNPVHYAENCIAIGKTPSKAADVFSLVEFMKYVEKTRVLSKKHSVIRVVHILQKMSSAGVLNNVGSRAGEARFFADCYLFIDTYSATPRGKGFLWLTPALGSDFLFHLSAPGVVHITGRNREGDVTGGTGLVVHPQHILTCCHVVRDMKPDRIQRFQDVQCVVEGNQIYSHKEDDVAFIRVDQPLQPIAGLVFQPPVIGKEVFTIGYPRIPYTQEAVLTMHPGSVTSESVVSFRGERLFLYSAISRPGNSGGPVMSQDGYIVGISSEHWRLGPIARKHLSLLITRESPLK